MVDRAEISNCRVTSLAVVENLDPLGDFLARDGYQVTFWDFLS